MLDILMAAAIAMAHPQSQAPVDTTVTVEEDSPQWDCRRDGNRICGDGAVLPDGSLAAPRTEGGSCQLTYQSRALAIPGRDKR